MDFPLLVDATGRACQYAASLAQRLLARAALQWRILVDGSTRRVRPWGVAIRCWKVCVAPLPSP